MPYDTAGLEILGTEECLSLLAQAPIGRIVFTDRALPAIQLVNFVLDDGEVIIRTGEGSKLAAAARNAIVAFEADDYDPVTRTGWSVVLVGASRVVTNAAELARLRTLPLEPWAPGPRDDFIRIRAGLLSGRRIRRGDPAS
ncbi:pyridoxamine 5'-phosphate oxidase family protein [Thermomonospora cellulosilytica]|uniref:Nitroimidazol reductase NimA-like FMN-containing flavoprotein (Pyridoxamine 5'-phosphate oxidase superfamily) n=1 Tax=Thermomonospora cellulosilytica TaxID=1411118 RepID=A0A7W3N0F5_9ACTN|nr:pyridoxamine 5'-phosphate oxidase family protein [Thermomonospora cellulosilytica]MBA9005244.1 nitroimidazol reductase NimA-like FMN-containing flavoprotein (pyridoxamine 5'-phosphate oxidase superfamily) [Thermomonospora cellulosilytica]